MKRNGLIGVLLLMAGLVTGQNGAVWREDFDTLDAWEPLSFPKIEKQTRYSLETLADRTVLKAEAKASASGLVLRAAFNPYKTPILHWRWRVENVLKKGDATRKEGDDYPLRVYVIFSYDPEKASFGMRAKYALAKKLHGEYPPHASLNYIWANRPHEKRILPSPYTDRSQMVVLRTGETETGQWLQEEVNILNDYRAAFGEDPPNEARLVLMSDADNTGGSATGWIDHIELFKSEASNNMGKLMP